MEDFRHNLSPVEVKLFLKITEDITENLFIIYCYKVSTPCPKCGHGETCNSGAVNLFSSRFDKITNEIKACLKCGYKELSTLLTVERL